MQKQVSDHTTGTVQPQVLQLGFDHNTVDLGSQVGFMQPPQPMDNTHTHTQSQQAPQSPSPRSQWPDGNGGPSRNGTRLHDQASFKGLQDQQANAQAMHDDLQKGNGDARMSTSLNQNRSQYQRRSDTDINVTDSSGPRPQHKLGRHVQPHNSTSGTSAFHPRLQRHHVP